MSMIEKILTAVMMTAIVAAYAACLVKAMVY